MKFRLLGFLLVAVSLFPVARIQAAAVPPTARVVSLDGKAEFLKSGENFWQALALNQELRVGDQIRTGAYCRVGLLFADQTLLRVNANSSFAIQPKKDPADNLVIRLFKGQLFYSVPQKPLVGQIVTSTVNAAIRGTEFVMTAAEDGESSLQVIEGAVRTTHKGGETIVDPRRAYQFTAAGARAQTTLVKPTDLVQWCISFPNVVTGRELTRSGEATARLHRLFGQLTNRDLEAKAAFLGEAPEGLSPAEKTVQAGLLGEVGEGARARRLLNSMGDYPPALAQKAIVLLVLNDVDGAAKAAEAAYRKAPQRLSSLLALSYVRQGQARLDDALHAAEAATKLEPLVAIAWARLAEMWLAVGEQDRALAASQRGLEVGRQDARILMANGFVLLANAKAEEAIERFREAVENDSSLGLAHMGLGLALIRRNHLPEGRSEIQVGALLEPNNSTLRSYLGKALYEEQIDKPYSSWRTDRGKAAAKQFSLAKLLDPNDPTPWYYDGMRLFRENKPVEALDSYRKAQDLNDRREVYRSKLQLDQDTAARSNRLGETYNQLGFSQEAELSFTRSILDDPTNFGAYASFPQSSDSLRLGNQIKALTLAPSNANRVGGLNDFDNVFERDNYHQREVTATVTDRGDLGGTAVAYGNFTNLSYAVGSAYTDNSRVAGGDRYGGFNDQDNYSRVQRTLLVFGPQYKDSFLLDISPPEINSSAIDLGGIPNDYVEYKTERYTFAHRHRFDRFSTLISGISAATTTRYDTLPGLTNDFSQKDRYYTGFNEYIYTDPELVNLEMGVDTTYIDPGEDNYSASRGRDTLTGYTFYAYPTWLLSKTVRLTTGLAWGHQENDYLLADRVSESRLAPKVGIFWDATPTTVVRAGVMRNTLGNTNALRLEPSLIAGEPQVADLASTTGLDIAFGSVRQEVYRNVWIGGLASAATQDKHYLTNNAGTIATRPGDDVIYTGQAWAEAVVTRFYSSALRFAYQTSDFEPSLLNVGGDSYFRQILWQNRLFNTGGWTLAADLVYQNTDSYLEVPARTAFPNDDFYANVGLGYQRPYQDWSVTIRAENINRQAEDLLWRLLVKVKF